MYGENDFIISEIIKVGGTLYTLYNHPDLMCNNKMLKMLLTQYKIRNFGIELVLLLSSRP